MLMRGEKKYYSSQPLLVKEEDLRYLDNFLRDNFATVKYTIYCVDDSELFPDSLDDLLAYENPAFKQIIRLKIDASSKTLLEGDEMEPPEEDDTELLKVIREIIERQHEKTRKMADEIGHILDPGERELKLQIGDPTTLYPRSTMRFTMHYADANWGIRVERELNERLKELRPWYWPFTRVNLVWTIAGLWFLVSVVYNLVLVIQKMTGTYVNTSGYELTLNEQLAVAFGIAFVLILLDSGFKRLRGYLFPKVFFCLGKQSDEFERRRKVLYAIFVVIGLGLVLEVVGGFFTNLVFG
jgi:hypothetical protein